MMSSLAKNIIVKSGSYSSEHLEKHIKDFDPVLSELTSKNLNGKENLKRLFDLETGKSHEDIVIETVKVFDLNTPTNQIAFNFVDATTTIVEKMHLLKRVSIDNQTQSNDWLIYLIKSNLLGEVIKDSKDNIMGPDGLEIFSQILAKKFCTADIPFLYELLQTTNVSEILSCTCIDHRFLMLVGAKIYIPYLFSLYEKGNFKFVVSELIYRLNFKAIQVTFHSLKNSARPFVVPTTMFIAGFFFTGHVKGVTDLQQMRHIYNEASKEYKFEGQLGDVIEGASLVLKKAGSAAGDLIKAPAQGFYFSLLRPLADSFFTTAEWLFKRK